MIGTYRDRTRRLADEAQTAVLEQHDRRAPMPLLVTLLVRHNARATALADLALTATLLRALRRPLPALGLGLPDDEPDRLTQALTTLFDDTNEPRPRLARLARAEPLAAGRRAYTAGMVERDVPGWRRRTGTDPCPLCRTLDDGSVLPPSVPMADHPGCSCTPVPVLEGGAR